MSQEIQKYIASIDALDKKADEKVAINGREIPQLTETYVAKFKKLQTELTKLDEQDASRRQIEKEMIGLLKSINPGNIQKEEIAVRSKVDAAISQIEKRTNTSANVPKGAPVENAPRKDYVPPEEYKLSQGFGIFGGNSVGHIMIGYGINESKESVVTKLKIDILRNFSGEMMKVQTLYIAKLHELMEIAKRESTSSLLKSAFDQLASWYKGAIKKITDSLKVRLSELDRYTKKSSSAKINNFIGAVAASATGSVSIDKVSGSKDDLLKAGSAGLALADGVKNELNQVADFLRPDIQELNARGGKSKNEVVSEAVASIIAQEAKKDAQKEERNKERAQKLSVDTLKYSGLGPAGNIVALLNNIFDD